MVGVDFSDAIFSTMRILRGNAGASLVKGDIYHLLFRRESFDFIYCLGALHHLLDPEARFQGLLPYLKKDEAVFIGVYSKKAHSERSTRGRADDYYASAIRVSQTVMLDPVAD